jgi:hypothetical protein
MSISIQSISDILVQGISAAPNQRILGARLGALLRTAYPGFSPADFQSRNLRQLIRTYVPAVEEKGRSGPDFIYGLALDSTRPVPGHPSVLARLPDNQTSPAPATFDWKAFSNPTYPFSLAANTETGEFQAIAGTEVTPPWVPLPKPTSEDHHGIAKAFTETLSGEVRQPLERVLEDPKWFVTFSSAAKRLGVGTAWAVFRTSQLRDRFRASLSVLGIPPRINSALANRRSAASLVAAGSSSSIPQSRYTELSQEERLRRLVSLVIADLPISDLRALNLPVGAVFDHIDEITKWQWRPMKIAYVAGFFSQVLDPLQAATPALLADRSVVWIRQRPDRQPDINQLKADLFDQGRRGATSILICIFVFREHEFVLQILEEIFGASRTPEIPPELLPRSMSSRRTGTFFLLSLSMI